MIRANRGLPATERAKAKERLHAVRTEVAAGKMNLAAAAKKYSECPTAKDGGDLGYIRRRGLPEDEPLAKAAFALKPGELSDVIETDYGFHILTVTDRKPGTPTPLEKCILEVLEEYTDDYRVTLVVDGKDVATKSVRVSGDTAITMTDADRKTWHDTAMQLHEMQAVTNEAAAAASIGNSANLSCQSTPSSAAIRRRTKGLPIGGALFWSWASSAAYSAGKASGMVAIIWATFMSGPLRPPRAVRSSAAWLERSSVPPPMRRPAMRAACPANAPPTCA